MGMGMYVDLPDGERAMDKEPLPRMLQVLGMNTQTLFLLHSFPPLIPTTHPLQHCLVLELGQSHNWSL